MIKIIKINEIETVNNENRGNIIKKLKLDKDKSSIVNSFVPITAIKKSNNHYVFIDDDLRNYIVYILKTARKKKM